LDFSVDAMNQFIELNPLNPTDHSHFANFSKKRILLPNIIPKRYPLGKIARRGPAIPQNKIFCSQFSRPRSNSKKSLHLSEHPLTLFVFLLNILSINFRRMGNSSCSSYKPGDCILDKIYFLPSSCKCNRDS
jgi:hypothetical protein